MRVHGWRAAANLSMLFADLPLTRRPAAAAAAGFDAVEMWWPFPTSAPSPREVDGLIDSLRDAAVDLVALNLPAGDMAAGDRGLAALPEAEDAFREGVFAAAAIGERTGCRLFNALYGNRVHTTDEGEQSRKAGGNLAFAADLLASFGGTVLIESLNPVENPRYLLPSSEAAAQTVHSLRSAGHGNVALLADLYRWATGGEDPSAAVTSSPGLIAHVQVADSPGRHEPGTGHIDFADCFDALSAIGYDGVVAAEYRPLRDTEQGLDWLRAHAAEGRR